MRKDLQLKHVEELLKKVEEEVAAIKRELAILKCEMSQCEDSKAVVSSEKSPGMLPNELDNEEARHVLDALVDIQVLDAEYQPLVHSWSQRGYLAKRIAEKLGIFQVWKVMGELWHLDNEASRKSLRSGYYRALDLAITGDLIDMIKPIL